MLAVAPAAVPPEPATALRRRAAGAGDDAGDLFCETLPNAVEEPHGPVTEHELAFAVGRGDQFRHVPGEVGAVGRHDSGHTGRDGSRWARRCEAAMGDFGLIGKVKDGAMVVRLARRVCGGDCHPFPLGSGTAGSGFRSSLTRPSGEISS
jgi:hypothetical protein